MPVDIHPEEKIPGVELILTRLHAGGKFSNRNYTFSGGLHGVGVSVVNALSTKVELFIKREGSEHRMEFRDGNAASKLEVVGTVGKKIPARGCVSGPTPSISIRPNSMCVRCGTCCAPRRCCAPA